MNVKKNHVTFEDTQFKQVMPMTMKKKKLHSPLRGPQRDKLLKNNSTYVLPILLHVKANPLPRYALCQNFLSVGLNSLLLLTMQTGCCSFEKSFSLVIEVKAQLTSFQSLALNFNVRSNLINESSL